MTGNEMKYAFLLKFDSLFEFDAPAYDDRQISYLLTEAQFRVFIKRYNPFGNKYQKGFEDDEQRRRDLEQLIRSAVISASENTDNVAYVGSCTIGSNIITGLDSIVGLNIGAKIYDAGATYFANDTVVTNIISNTSVEVSNNALANGVDINLVGGLGKSMYQGHTHPNGVYLDLPDGFLYAVEESAQFTPASALEIPIKPVKHDEYLPNIQNPYKKPYANLIWRMDISRGQFAQGTVQEASLKRTELITDGVNPLSYYRVKYLSLPPEIICDVYYPENQKHCILDETLHREIVDEAVTIANAAAKQGDYQIGLSEKQRSE